MSAELIGTRKSILLNATVLLDLTFFTQHMMGFSQRLQNTIHNIFMQSIPILEILNDSELIIHLFLQYIFFHLWVMCTFVFISFFAFLSRFFICGFYSSLLLHFNFSFISMDYSDNSFSIHHNLNVLWVI